MSKPFCEICALRQLFRVRGVTVSAEGAPITLCDNCATLVGADGALHRNVGVAVDGWPVRVIVKDGQLVRDPRDR